VNKRVACLESGNLALVIIDADDMVAHFGEADRGDQTNVSRPDNGNFDVFTHSALVLFLIVENTRIEKQSRGFESNRHCFETGTPMRPSNLPSGTRARVD
jgi:hypothetical protein